jgi:serine protease Do
MISDKLYRRVTWLAALVLMVGVGLAGPPFAWADEDANAIQQAKGLSRAFRAAAKSVLPTVVMVKTSTKPPESRGPSIPRIPPFRGSPLEDFFGEGDPRIQRAPQPGLGSGVIIDASGIILTNNHVIEDADEVIIQLADGREFKVVSSNVDAETDLAVMRIETDQLLPAAKLGDSDKLEIGDWVLAVGNPFALESTVSAGIISAKGRALGAVRRARFLQTDAAINPGNSGGPLVNLDGEVVGINTAIFSRNGGYQGIGFAVPVNLAKWVTSQLIQGGVVRRTYLGVGMVPVTAEDAEKLGVRPGQGVLVETVFDGSPAKKAGLQVDDVILSFDGRPIASTSDLQEIVERLEADSEHQIDILRQRKPSTVAVVVQAMPEDFSNSKPPSIMGGLSSFYRDGQLGLTVMDLAEEMAKRFGYGDHSGVLILDVEPGRVAAKAGLGERMLIGRVGEKSVANVEEFKAAIQEESLDKGITIEVHTPHGSKTVTLKRD